MEGTLIADAFRPLDSPEHERTLRLGDAKTIFSPNTAPAVLTLFGPSAHTMGTMSSAMGIAALDGSRFMTEYLHSVTPRNFGTFRLHTAVLRKSWEPSHLLDQPATGDLISAPSLSLTQAVSHDA